MPKGFGAIQEAAERISKRSKGGDYGPPVFWFQLPGDGDAAVVRFLEQGDEAYSYYYHDFSHIDERFGWQSQVTCLDQEDSGVPCPGCEAELPRKLKGIFNLIWRDAPKYKRDEDGNFERDGKDNLIQEGNEDQVAVWRGGPELCKLLSKKDVAFRGLSSRDFHVERNGLKLDTTYAVEPNDPDGGAQKLTATDKELAKEAYDLEEIARYREYDDAKEYIEYKLSDLEGDGDDDTSDFLKEKKDSPFASE